MAEVQEVKVKKIRRIRHRDRTAQLPIYLGKLFRGFLFQNDWKVLPMTAIIAALVSMVVRRSFFQSMEGTLKGAFALCCVAIWNGCFNSIQVICRERAIIKREHRSGMHVSAYVFCHMIYQAVLCLAQSILTLVVIRRLGVPVPEKGFITPFMMVDLTISLFLISYASDMISLFVSSIVHTTTAAMTIMPFLLIFQLVFSGGVFSLPDFAKPISNFTISNYGLRCIAAQGDYNHKPLTTAWDTLIKLRDRDIPISVTVGQAVDALEETKDTAIMTTLRDTKLLSLKNPETGEPIAELAVGQLLDLATQLPIVQENRDAAFNCTLKVNDLIELVGEEKLKETLLTETAAAARIPEYEQSIDNIVGCWVILGAFIVLFAILSVISLEFIDKDKR